MPSLLCLFKVSVFYIYMVERGERCVGRGKQQRTHAEFVTKLSGQRGVCFLIERERERLN